jgi:translation initiation factor 2 alpha subunit (eIF-2alpha)
MPQDSTRKLLREFGVAVTAFEDAVEAGQGEAAKKAESGLREHLKGLIELVERLSEQAAKL